MVNQQYEDCIQACIECIEACNVCFDSCLKEENVKMMAECIRMDRECAEICGMAVTAMQTNSHFVKQICGLCAEICEACGNEAKGMTMNTVKNVLKLALSAQKNAEKWHPNNKRTSKHQAGSFYV